MEAVGSLGLPFPQSKPVLQKPHVITRVAAGFLETILIEVSRPVRESFIVRIFDEDHTPPAAEIAATYVFYGVAVPTVARRLESAWNALNLRVSKGARYASYVTYDHSRGYSLVIASIETLQESFLP
jgi:hypothetical protein